MLSRVFVNASVPACIRVLACVQVRASLHPGTKLLLHAVAAANAGVRACVQARASLHRGTQLLTHAVAAGVHEDCAHGPHCAGVRHADIGKNSLCLQSLMTMPKGVYGAT